MTARGAVRSSVQAGGAWGVAVCGYVRSEGFVNDG